MNRANWPVVAAVLVATLAATTAPTARDASFVNAVLQIGDREYAAAAVESDSGSRSTGDYAQRVMSDYGTLNTQLLALAAKFHVRVLHRTLPASAPSPVPQAKTGAAKERLLDSAPYRPATYLADDMQRQQHLTALLAAEARDGDNSAFRAFARSMAPMVKNELALARHAQDLVARSKPR